MKDVNIFIKKNEEYNDKELMVISVLNALYGVKNTLLIVTVEFIFYYIMERWSNYKQDKTILNGIKKGLDSLASRNIIEVLDRKKDMYVLSPKGLTVDTDNEWFVVVRDWELRRIFANCNKPFKVYELFVKLVGTINSKTKEYHMSQEQMIAYFGIVGSKTTLNDYIRQLEDLKLIYMYRPKRRRMDGTYHNINNVYGRYEDMRDIITSAQEYIDTVDSIQYSTRIDRRSIKTRYNNYLKGSAKYSDFNTVKELYQDCIKYNKSLKSNPIYGGYGEEKQYQEAGELDLSVFPADLQKEEESWGEYKDVDAFIDDLLTFNHIKKE